MSDGCLQRTKACFLGPGPVPFPHYLPAYLPETFISARGTKNTLDFTIRPRLMLVLAFHFESCAILSKPCEF